MDQVAEKRETATAVVLHQWVHHQLREAFGDAADGICIQVWIHTCEHVSKESDAVGEQFTIWVKANHHQMSFEGHDLQSVIQKFKGRGMQDVALALGERLVKEFDPISLGC